jgi:hypothetical protein
MAQDAHERLVAGLTTPEELLRVLPYTAVAEHRARFSRSADRMVLHRVAP